jgi:hypothetical protein
MDVIYKLCNINYLNISRFAFQINPNSQRILQELDDEVIIQKDKFTDYIKLEYTTAIIYNIIISIPSLIYFFSHWGTQSYYEMIPSFWILLVSITKLLEIIPKAVIINQTIRIGNNSNDELIASRKFLYMTRSYFFIFNSILGYALLINYGIFFLFIRKSSVCDSAPQFSFIFNWLILGFFLRLVISFINYFLHFKYGLDYLNFEDTIFYKAYNNRVSKEVLESIPSVELTEANLKEKVIVYENNETDLCCICMLQFEISAKVKTLPCDKRHVFHNCCIDKWLSHNKACPTCRTEINKELLLKKKL